MSVGQMLEHMLGGRRGYLERVGSPAAQQITVQTEEGDQPFWKVTLDIAQLRVAFTQADAAVLSGVQDAERGLQRFRQHFVSHPAQLLALLLVHDANHRGQITVLLRQGGRPEGTLNRLAASTWSIWRE